MSLAFSLKSHLLALKVTVRPRTLQVRYFVVFLLLSASSPQIPTPKITTGSRSRSSSPYCGLGTWSLAGSSGWTLKPCFFPSGLAVVFRCNSPHLNELIICPSWLVSFLLLFFIIEMLCVLSLFYFPGLNQVLLSPSYGQGVIFDGGEQDSNACKDSSNNHPISVDNGSIHTWLSRISWSLRALTAFKDRMKPFNRHSYNFQINHFPIQ